MAHYDFSAKDANMLINGDIDGALYNMIREYNKYIDEDYVSNRVKRVADEAKQSTAYGVFVANDACVADEQGHFDWSHKSV